MADWEDDGSNERTALLTGSSTASGIVTLRGDCSQRRAEYTGEVRSHSARSQPCWRPEQHLFTKKGQNASREASGPSCEDELVAHDVSDEQASLGGLTLAQLRNELQKLKAELVEELCSERSCVPTRNPVHVEREHIQCSGTRPRGAVRAQATGKSERELVGATCGSDTYANGFHEKAKEKSKKSAVEEDKPMRRKSIIGGLQRSNFHTHNEEDDETVLFEQEQGCSCLALTFNSHSYGYFMSAAVIVNVAFFMAQADYMARSWSQEVPFCFDIAEYVSMLVFFVDIVARVCLLRCKFFIGPHWKSNVFDSTLVALQLFEAGMRCFPAVNDEDELHNLNLLRVLRVARVLRLTRVLHLIPEFHMIIVSIGTAMRSLVWAFLLVGIVTSIFGVIITQIVTDHKIKIGREAMEEQAVLEEYFGNLGVSVLRLYMIISDGCHWENLATPLMQHCSPWIYLVFVAYTAFIVFAFTNVVTAVFVESAHKATEEDRHANISHLVMGSFVEQGSKASQITKDAFVSSLNDPHMVQYLQTLSLTPEEVKNSHFFELLDRNRHGQVGHDDFQAGCLRLIGPAKALDLAALSLEVKQQQMMNTSCHQQTQKALKFIADQVHFLAEASGAHLPSLPEQVTPKCTFSDFSPQVSSTSEPEAFVRQVSEVMVAMQQQAYMRQIS